MTISTAKTAAPVAAPVLFTGKGAKARNEAFAKITPLSFAEDKSRAASVANMALVLGNAPSELEVKAGKVQWIIGRVASRLPANARPALRGDAALLTFAEQLVTRYAYPLKAGSNGKTLKAGQLGRRTEAQHKVVRAAEEACSVFFAELGLSNAKTNAERDKQASAKAKTANAPSASGAGKGQLATPDHGALVTPSAPVSSDDYVQHMQTQLAALLAYDLSLIHI